MEVSGMGSMWSTGRYEYGKPLTITPGIPASISLKFKGDGNRDVGSMFSLTSEQALLATGRSGLERGRFNWLIVKSSFNVLIRHIKRTGHP